MRISFIRGYPLQASVLLFVNIFLLVIISSQDCLGQASNLEMKNFQVQNQVKTKDNKTKDEAELNESVEEDDLIKELKIFTDVLSIVRKDYVQPVGSKKLVEGALKGMVSSLDPHSSYLDKEFYKDLQSQTKGEFGGLGLEITMKDGQLVVVAPMEGSPAEASGVRSGDTIVKIAGEFTKQMTLVDAVKKLRGPRGSQIEVSVMRKNSPNLIDISITREIINVKSTKGRVIADGFLYARISQFVEKTTSELKALLQQAKNSSSTGEIKGLILDLRNNPGGLLTQAVEVSDLFLKEGVIVYTDGRVEAQKQKFYAEERGTEPNYPIVIIVNGGSASASEIVAGALKDHGRAIVLGTQTFGKGSVQTITPLSNGGALTLTTALYYTKSGKSLQALGVKPDVEYDQPLVTAATGDTKNGDGMDKQEKVNQPSEAGFIRESDLPGAIKNPLNLDDDAKSKIIKNDENKPKTVIEKSEDLKPINIEKDDINVIFERDPQLKKAFELVSSF